MRAENRTATEMAVDAIDAIDVVSDNLEQRGASVQQPIQEVEAGARLAITIQNAIDYALNKQHKDGYWVGTLDSNSTMEAEYLLLTHILGIGTKEMWRKLANKILSDQRDDGTWAQYYEGDGDLSTSIECYFALKLAGISADEPNMRKAKAFILSKGGIPKARIFTHIWLALFGQWSWDALPILPPEIMFLPHWAPVNIYEFASWARATIVPMSIILTKRPHFAIPERAAIDELFPEAYSPQQSLTKRPTSWLSWRGIFHLFDKALHHYEKLSWKPGRERALKKAERWVDEHQEADGCWGGIQPPWVYSLIMYKTLGYGLEHPAIKKGIEGFADYNIETQDTLQTQACVSPVWDTGLMMVALQDAGLALNHPALQQACRWLVGKQILSGGDWQVKNPHTPPGGWSFEYVNERYPDIDDCAEILIALPRITMPKDEQRKTQQAIIRGTHWMISMQSRQGGWAAFDQDNDSSFLTKMPFFDFGETLDPPSVDVTAHVIEALGHMGYQNDHPAIKQGLRFIYSEQEENGTWFGRWGVNYIYGLGAVLPALEAVGEDMQKPRIKKAVQWLIEQQNDDGGWGESCASYVDPTLHGSGPSTASQTGWALLALLSAGEWQHSAVKKGIDYLCMTMTDEGTWDEPYYTGCGFPGYGVGKRLDNRPQEGEIGYQGRELPAAFMINYNLYRHYWPLMALGRYQSIKAQSTS